MKKVFQISLVAGCLLWGGFVTDAAASRHATTAPGQTIIHDKQPVYEQNNINTRIQKILAAHNSQSSAPLTNMTINRLAVNTLDQGGTLLFSDSPEYVEQNGILYQDVVNGTARVLYYHLNNTDRPKKIAITLENMYDGLNSVKITRGVAGGPSADFLAVGKQTQEQYFSNDSEQQMLLLKKQIRLLDNKMNEIIVKPGELVYGVYDFFAKQPVKVTSLMYDVEENPLTVVKNLPILLRDSVALRGTLDNMNRQISLQQPFDTNQAKAGYIVIGDDKFDEFKLGKDATDGQTTKNVGNYGVLYQIDLSIIGDKAVQCYLSPLGGVYAGAMRVIAEKEGEAMIPTPLNKPFFGDNTPPDTEETAKAWQAGKLTITNRTEKTDLGIYKPGQTVRFEYSPPGASNLPAVLILQTVE